MPAAMESSQNIENPLEFFTISSKNVFFLQISSKMFFFFWKSRKFSPDLENLLRDLAGRARDLPAGLEISRPGRNPPNLTAPKNRFPALPLPSNFFWGDASFRSRWFRMFLNFSPISILLNRMAILSAAVPPTPPTGSLVRTLGGPLIRGSPHLVEINKINRNQ